MSYASDSVYNIIADQGATFLRSITLKNPAKQVVTLTGYTGRMHIRVTEDAASIISTLTTENGKLSITANTGTVNINIPAAEMEAMEPGDYAYDLELEETATGIVTRIIQGSFKLRAEVTR
jgi:hypothetical protein